MRVGGRLALPALLAVALWINPALVLAQPAPHLGAGSRFMRIAGLPTDGEVWARDALDTPAQWRLLVVPGSGCVSLTSSMNRLAHSLRHAQVLLLQKPHLAPGTQAVDAACSDEFIAADNLADWQSRAIRLARQSLAATDSTLPLVLAGLSEGAELLPGLVQALPEAEALVMVGNAGLDPATVAGLQADRLGAGAAWQRLMRAAAGSPSPQRLLEGRNLRYWQVLLDWPLQAALLADPRPLLHAWGGHDALIPAAAFARFAAAARQRSGGYCALQFPAADHQLRTADNDELQTLWALLDQAASRRRQTAAASMPGWPTDCAGWLAPTVGP